MLRILSLVIVCVILIVAVPASVAADDDSLDAAVARVRKMVDEGWPTRDIAKVVSKIVDDRVINANSWERLTIWRNVLDFLPFVDDYPGEQALDDFRARGMSEYDETAEWVWGSQYGQCEECVCLAYYILKKSRVLDNYRILATTAGHSGHAFVVLGIEDGADSNNPNTWGENAYIVDGWTGKSLTAAKAYESGTYSSEGSEKIADKTKAYDKTAVVWKVDESRGDGDLFEILDECFIVTAAYGTKTAIEIDILRSFRDEFLADHSLGRSFVEFYYRNSSPIAEYIAKRPVIRYLVKTYLVQPCVVITTLTEGLWSD